MGSNVAAVSLAIGYPTIASVPHQIAAGFANLMAIAAATEIDFAEAAQLKAFLADPSAFAQQIPQLKRKQQRKRHQLKNLMKTRTHPVVVWTCSAICSKHTISSRFYQDNKLDFLVN